MTALRGAELIADLARPKAARSATAPPLALGSLLCGYAIDSGMFGLHHVICQTLVRVCGSPHAETNAAILPRAMAFWSPAPPTGSPPSPRRSAPTPTDIEARVLELGGNPAGLGAIGADRTKLDRGPRRRCSLRPELAFTPGPALTRDGPRRS